MSREAGIPISEVTMWDMSVISSTSLSKRFSGGLHVRLHAYHSLGLKIVEIVR